MIGSRKRLCFQKSQMMTALALPSKRNKVSYTSRDNLKCATNSGGQKKSKWARMGMNPLKLIRARSPSPLMVAGRPNRTKTHKKQLNGKIQSSKQSPVKQFQWSFFVALFVARCVSTHFQLHIAPIWHCRWCEHLPQKEPFGVSKGWSYKTLTSTLTEPKSSRFIETFQWNCFTLESLAWHFTTDTKSLLHLPNGAGHVKLLQPKYCEQNTADSPCKSEQNTGPETIE